MQPDEILPHSCPAPEPAAALDRRAVMAAGAAALAGATVAALVKADDASAAHNTAVAYDSQTAMHVDVTNTTAGSTRILSNVSGTAAFVGLNNYPVGISRPDGILGRTAYTTSNAAGTAGSNEAASGGIGVLGTTSAANGTGVYGVAGQVAPGELSGGGVGVFGRGSERGVLGRSVSGSGVRGETDAGDALYGLATGAGLAARLVGAARVEGALDVTGAATAGSAAIAGAATAASLAVTGVASAATLAVAGKAASGTLDVQGSAAIHGTATLGALSLPQRSGVVVIRKGRRTVTVSVPVGPASLAVATLQRFVPGLRIEAAVPNAAKDRVTLHLNRKAPKAVPAAWLVVG